MTSLPWFEALQFSLRVMRKSFFKLFIPAMALSYVMGAFHVLLVYFFEMNSHFGHPRASIALIMIAIMILLPLPTYAYLYPLLKRYVLFHGLRELNPFPFNEYKVLSLRIRYRYFLRLIKISLKRYLFQTIAFLTLILLSFVNIYDLFLGYHQDIDIVGSTLIVIFVSIIALWPLAVSYYNYFFAELRYLDEKSQELRSDSMTSVSPILPHKKLFWPILSWKAILFVAFIALLFVLSFSWSYIATFCDSQSCGMGNGNLFREILSFFTDGLSESLSPFLTINFLFVSFPSVWFNISGSSLPYTLWIQTFFLLLFGLLTAFFFLVETLSTVYFYHRCRGKDEEALSKEPEPPEEID